LLGRWRALYLPQQVPEHTKEHPLAGPVAVDGLVYLLDQLQGRPGVALALDQATARALNLILYLALDLAQARLPGFGEALGLDQAGAMQLLVGAINASFVGCR
jgi:hypothetical protein